MSPEQRPSFGPRSADLLTRLQAMPRLVVPVAALVLLLVGLLAPATFGVAALVPLTLLVAWLATLSWPTLDRGGRVLRMIAVGALIGVLVSRVVEWLA